MQLARTPMPRAPRVSPPLAYSRGIGSVPVLSPIVIPLRSHHTLVRLIGNLPIGGQSEFETTRGGLVRTTRVADGTFEVTRFRAVAAAGNRRFPELSIRFLRTTEGRFCPIRFAVDRNDTTDIGGDGDASEAVSEHEQRWVAEHADEWLQRIERSLLDSPVARAG